MISEIKVCIGIILNGRATYISIVACAITIPLFGAAVDGPGLSFGQNLILLKGKIDLFHNKVDLVFAPGMD